MIWVVLVTGILAIVAYLYNRMVAMRRLTENAWADMDVYLKRRAELVPNLVEAVKGAAAYERGTLEHVVQARSQALASPGPSHERAAAESELTRGVGQVFVMSEAYPNLRSSENFLSLQRELTETERLIASSRQYYNACVRDYNTMIESFPQNVLANPLGFRPKEFFEIENLSERQAPGVQGLS